MGLAEQIINPRFVLAAVFHDDEQAKSALSRVLRFVGETLADVSSEDAARFKHAVSPYTLMKQSGIQKYIDNLEFSTPVPPSETLRSILFPLGAPHTRYEGLLNLHIAGAVSVVDIHLGAAALNLPIDALLETLANGMSGGKARESLTPQALQNLLGIANKPTETAGWVFVAFSIIDGIYHRISRLRIRHEHLLRQSRREAEAAEEARRRAAAEAAERLGRFKAPVLEKAIPDYAGHDSKPDPLAATSEAMVMDELRRYRVWAGNKSLRELSALTGNNVSHATLGNLLSSKKVPKKLSHLLTLITALGGDEEDLRRWATAWRHFQVPGPAAETEKKDKPGSSRLRLTG
ncbi:hypothetical protein GT755_38305 [Herbidospora sp. NEAU-GS84]|uniref:Uncharacterized protein n=1 Tax=Herbidospora solisilvae TaxID=2696284 RepID=A0A7C9JD14_9ACTN|nr:hypothetical protein [Herbidospora solisilvae]NAS27508.1 hypothetical protein [Herbidospora solisilvae]